MENYIVINGKKAELTDEQLKALGIEVEKNDPFKLKEDEYFYINPCGEVIEDFYCSGCVVSKHRHDVANYCADKDLMEQRALHETLNRLLWRYSMQHDADKIEYGNRDSYKWCIYYSFNHNGFEPISWYTMYPFSNVCFLTKEIAEAAIKEIVIPFMEKHPRFKW